MKSFRTEIENPIVEQDILELERKIHEFHHGEIDEERFRTLRLARGVYGQRQSGVQMIRIKVPYGKLTSQQLLRIAQVADEYSDGNLHITTRQDIQIHHVNLDRTPELWAELEKDEITLREACGNTVRNITCSATSGIDPNEVFDVRPCAEAVFQYFLRNPICQEMGRKIKISFSINDEDSALSFMHDIGFIAKKREGVHGFKVMVAGGLGSQARQADVFHEFIEQDKIIPLTEAILRVFDRYGERKNRMKARLKFLLRDIGIDQFKELVNQELLSLENSTIPVAYEEVLPEVRKDLPSLQVDEKELSAFENWKKNNVIQQKQIDLFSIQLKIQLGNIKTSKIKQLTGLISEYSGNEVTLTIRQNLMIRHVPENQLPRFYELLKSLSLVNDGYEQVADITSCPGTDTCNLGIANTTGLSVAIEQELGKHSISDDQMTIKISGCMNSCGQHMIANVGFQGMSIKTKDKRVIPAVQVLIGGGIIGDGEGRFADKVIKIPGKRAVQALKILLNDFQDSGHDKFLNHYDLKGKQHFYQLLKPLADVEQVRDDEFIDWGQSQHYKKEIGIGECAGVVIDLVSTLFKESEEKLKLAEIAFKEENYPDSAYHSYNSVVNTSKALLISENHTCNSHHKIIRDFDEMFIQSKQILLRKAFNELAPGIIQRKPSKLVAEEALNDAIEFNQTVYKFRENRLNNEN